MKKHFTDFIGEYVYVRKYKNCQEIYGEKVLLLCAIKGSKHVKILTKDNETVYAWKADLKLPKEDKV